jgi:peptide/nickel transport system ATP-binding protein
MVVCAAVSPVETTMVEGRRVSCWLHGPDERIPEGGVSALEREAIAVAEEA